MGTGSILSSVHLHLHLRVAPDEMLHECSLIRRYRLLLQLPYKPHFVDITVGSALRVPLSFGWSIWSPETANTEPYVIKITNVL